MSRIVLFFGLRKRDIFYYCSGFLSFERVGISVESQLNGTVYIISYLFCLCLFCFTSFFNYHECLILRDSGWTLVQALSIFQTICYLSEANALYRPEKTHALYVFFNLRVYWCWSKITFWGRTFSLNSTSAAPLNCILRRDFDCNKIEQDL